MTPTAMTQAALDRLCALCGIETEYTDIWGRRHAVPAKTKRALLTAMGVRTGSGQRLKAALENQEGRPWRRSLPPVLVVREGDGPAVIPLTLPEARWEGQLRWTLTPEDGEGFGGEFNPAEMEVLARRTLDGTALARFAFALPRSPGIGYHAFALEDGSGVAMRLIVTPDRCYQPEVLAGEGRVWGYSLQLYALRSARNWGIGDFGDLHGAVAFAAAQGADLLGVNPLNALFPHVPSHVSPYSPSSRIFLNSLYLDVEAIADFAECEVALETVRQPQFQAQLRALRTSERVDYGKVAAASLPILERLYGEFRRRHLETDSERGRASRDFQTQEGEALRRHALFEALLGYFQSQDASSWGWHAWPKAYRNPESAEVAAFLSANLERVEFYEYLQWQAELQLESVGSRAMELELGIGLYLDLAVSVDRGGAETWANQRLYALNASIGAPPDDFSPHGQDWGLPPMLPEQLAESAYAPFIATLRKNMCHAGALRIDHVMGLMRLFWVPSGGMPDDGAYVSYPLDDLLGILALESQRNRCMVVGEDLGTVPEVLCKALEPMGVLSTRLLYFEKEVSGDFKSPEDYPAHALVAVATHDLPTLAGYWQGIDLDTRTALGLFPSDDLRQRQIIARSGDRASLLVALEREGLLPVGTSVHPVLVPQMTPELACAVHRYLARAPARVLMVQIEDALGQPEQANLPGTLDQYPNWRRRVALNLEQWAADPRLAALADAIRQERGAAVQPGTPSHPEESGGQLRIPAATYRLQFNRGFTFAQAAELVPYLHELGVSHCYASPYLKARPGSAHGYDIIDHGALNPELGAVEDFDRFVEALHRYGMGQVLDIVPNHMAVMGGDNEWWLDVLENGQAAVHAGYFDIDWSPVNGLGGGKVRVPVLGDHYGAVLEKGELKLTFDAARGEFSVLYYHHRFPVDPREYPLILGLRPETLEARIGAEDPYLDAFRTLITAFGHLPGRDDLLPPQVAERNRDKEVHKEHLAMMYAQSPDLAWFIGETVALLNGTPGEAWSFDGLHGLLEAQAYRLAYWRVAADEINYRRFFDINELAGLRMDNRDAFEAAHRLVFELLEQGKVDGLRVDHPDGLYDPLQYFRRLRERSACYLVVEKILAGEERLPDDWPVQGTTGYDFANLVNGLFVQPGAVAGMERTYAVFLGGKLDFEDLLYRSRRLIIRAAMAGELNVLAHQLGRIAQADRHTRDYTINSLRDALTEVVACFPVYRTYITGEGASDEDRRVLEIAVEAARKRSRAADISVFEFVGEALLVNLPQGRSDDERQAVAAFAMKFQQYTAPVMAKGMEDTGFYQYHRLTSLNEVGGDPRRFGVSLEQFHRANAERARRWPHAMLATSTHDSKRSEDVRMRIDVLTELSGEWRQHLARWSRINRAKIRNIDGARCPSRNDEYLLYQTLLGAWPLGALDDGGRAAFRERIERYMLKAAREAKQHSSWINPNTAYEEGMEKFVSALLGPMPNRFLAEFLPLQGRVARYGMLNSLSQTLLKLAAPGVPDIYQGNESWDFSLVDPDNRRPVDFELRRRMLLELQALDGTPGLAGDLLRNLEDGRVKLYLTWKALSLRRQHESLFRDGKYIPLHAGGAQAERLCAFARKRQRQVVLAVAARWFTDLSPASELPLGQVWTGTWLEVPISHAGSVWVNAFTGEKITAYDRNGVPVLDAEKIFRSFTCGLLLPEGR
jgi:(1->4)-alpha-D-glucan 1-alpha-D-glucosylmutase